MLWLLLIQAMSSRPPACEQPALHECTAGARAADEGPPLTLTMARSVTQGIANGRTIASTEWDCEVQIIGRGKTVKAQHHSDDLHFNLRPGSYVVRLDACFGCAMDVPVTIAKGKATVVEARCHTQGK